MTLEGPTSSNCTFCFSRKTYERIIAIGGERVIYRHCSSCKRDLRLWEGSEREYQRRRATLNRIRRKLRAKERNMRLQDDQNHWL